MPARPTAMGEISLGCCRSGPHPWSSPPHPGGHRFITRGRFCLFSARPDLSGGVSFQLKRHVPCPHRRQEPLSAVCRQTLGRKGTGS